MSCMAWEVSRLGVLAVVESGAGAVGLLLEGLACFPLGGLFDLISEVGDCGERSSSRGSSGEHLASRGSLSRPRAGLVGLSRLELRSVLAEVGELVLGERMATGPSWALTGLELNGEVPVSAAIGIFVRADGLGWGGHCIRVATAGETGRLPAESGEAIPALG